MDRAGEDDPPGLLHGEEEPREESDGELAPSRTGGGGSSLGLVPTSTTSSTGEDAGDFLSPGAALALVSSGGGPEAVVRRARALSVLSSTGLGGDDNDDDDDEWGDDDFATPRDVRQLYADHSAADLAAQLLHAAAAGDGQYVRSLLALLPARPDLDPNATGATDDNSDAAGSGSGRLTALIAACVGRLVATSGTLSVGVGGGAAKVAAGAAAPPVIRLTMSRLDAIDALVEAPGVDVNRRDAGSSRAPPLWHAANAGHEWAVERLVAGSAAAGVGHPQKTASIQLETLRCSINCTAAKAFLRRHM